MHGAAPRDRLAVALDVADLARARALLDALAGSVGWFKIGAELFTAAGPQALRAARRHGRVFLDTKLHDIPNSVAAAVRAATRHGVDLLTVHAAGGLDMLKAAREAADDAASALGSPPPRLLGVTVLTSFSEPLLREVGMVGPLSAQVERLGELARRAGLDGLVTSPHEVASARRRFGEELLLVVPGVRAPGSPSDDQARSAGPGEAIRAGADLLVVGRPIVRSASPRAEAQRFVEAIGKALDAP